MSTVSSTEGEGAVARDELQRLVDELAARLRRAVVVDDPGVRLICASRHYGDEDPQRVRAVLQREVGAEVVKHILDQGAAKWDGPGVVPAREDIGMARRVVQPLRWRGFLLGMIIVIDADASLGPEGLDDIVRTSSAVAACLYRDQVTGDEERAARESAVVELLDPDAARRRTGVEFFHAHAWLHDARPLTVTVFDVSGGAGESVHVEAALRSALEDVVRGRPVRTAFCVTGERAALIESWDRVPTATEVRARATNLAASLANLCGTRGCVTTGVGGSCGELADAWRAHRQARYAIDVASRLGRDGEVILWSELGVYGLLVQLPEDVLTATMVPEPVRRLVAADPQGTLVSTLACYLDRAGSSTRAAEALTVHRTTLYYRLDRIREITGADLDDGTALLELHLGLRLAELVGLGRGVDGGGAHPGDAGFRQSEQAPA